MKFYWILIIFLGLVSIPQIGKSAGALQSQCYGTPSKGRLEHGKLLPIKGKNFSSYSLLGSILGRTAVHNQVKDIILTAYQNLASSTPEKVFVYGETGWVKGGSFKPHKTHQNGLSVDFFVPVLNPKGQSTRLPTHALNKWGYGIEFDSQGVYKNYSIDFEAISKHLYFLDQTAKAKGVKIRRVIFDPGLTQKLEDTNRWPYLKRNLTFSKKRSWVRHDEHYHVDFEIPCKPL